MTFLLVGLGALASFWVQPLLVRVRALLVRHVPICMAEVFLSNYWIAQIIINLKDSGPHDSFNNKSSDTNILHTPSSNQLEELCFGSRGLHSSISIYSRN